ncbi:hypothetical protein [Lichenihabitans psoromatis]|uniref:hypothetical protein n=1 Tax=Lichenihabitans psoromatis TaxID=2528642 RepID=UPI00103840FF|nr:hypothetical protein [Lichenihabitans psoromatis]
MIEMKNLSSLLGPEFGPFLYASVGDEGNGMMLSVLSALARRDLDPWKEAAELAKLPVDAAAKRLASLIAGLPGTAGRLEAGAAANRLILLLPNSSSTVPLSATIIEDNLGLTKGSLVIWMIVMSLIMGAQVLAASQQPSARTQQAASLAATSVTTVKGPPLGSGQ